MISKKPIVQMSKEQVKAGLKMWDVTGRKGMTLSKGQSQDFEANAPKTWLRYENSKGELLSAPIECELYTVPRTSGANEMVAMLHGMCPKCGETFIVREDNKTMFLGHVEYQRARPWLKEQWERHCSAKSRRPEANDKIPVVTSPERWLCDYCKGWCVKVEDGVARDDLRGATIMSIPVRGLLKEEEPKPKMVDL